ncbi:hypothetical protein KR018_012432, partial [Drosophila ironensis]
MKSPIPKLHFIDPELDEDDAMPSYTSTPKLNANAQVFVPRCQQQLFKENDSQAQDKRFEASEPKSKVKLTLPWKGFPKKMESTSRSAQVVLLNDMDYMIMPRIKRGKKPKDDIKSLIQESKPPGPKDEEAKNSAAAQMPPEKRLEAEAKRREHERKVALEALKLVEQRRMRAPLMELNSTRRMPKTFVHLSRSPVRFTPDERQKVDRLRIAKKDRIERVLKEMKAEPRNNNAQAQTQEPRKKSAQQPYGSRWAKTTEVGSVGNKKRYIPTTKEWDEKCRVKQLSILENKENVNDENLNNIWETSTFASKAIAKQPFWSTAGNIMVPKPEDPKADLIPRYRPPAKLLEGEKRKGNLTHHRPIPNWTARSEEQSPMKTLINKHGKCVRRYTIEQLLKIEPQPDELEKLNFDESMKDLGFL